MYLTCFVTFEENTCILIFCMYCTRIPKESKIHFWNTYKIQQDTCILRASLVSHWIHIRIHQDTCILDASSRYIKIHRDTNHDTCETLPRYMMGYMYPKCILRGTYLRCRMHAGYMRDTCICKGDQDTCGIHPRYMMRYMYLKFIQTDMYLI